MFSKELYELDKNTVQYMIDEMQDTIDAQKEELGQQKEELGRQKEEIGQQQGVIDEQKEKINKMQEEQEKAIKGTIDMLRNMHMSEPEIIQKICGLYGINEEQVRKYL